MKYFNRLITIAVIVLVIVLSIINIWFVFKANGNSIRNSENIALLKEKIAKLEKTLNNLPVPKDGYTPIKGIDYFDGKDGIGRNGIDSKSTIEKETIIKEIPILAKDGKTPTLRCNDKKDRWEVGYIGDENYGVVLDTENRPVRCVIRP